MILALRQGGYTLVMRHANSPEQPPDKDAADPENDKMERQLDPIGRQAAKMLGASIRALDVPIDGAHLGTLAGQCRRDSTSIAQQVMLRLTRPHHNCLLAFHASDHGDPFG